MASKDFLQFNLIQIYKTCEAKKNSQSNIPKIPHNPKNPSSDRRQEMGEG